MLQLSNMEIILIDLLIKQVLMFFIHQAQVAHKVIISSCNARVPGKGKYALIRFYAKYFALLI